MLLRNEVYNLSIGFLPNWVKSGCYSLWQISLFKFAGFRKEVLSSNLKLPTADGKDFIYGYNKTFPMRVIF